MYNGLVSCLIYIPFNHVPRFYNFGVRFRAGLKSENQVVGLAMTLQPIFLNRGAHGVSLANFLSIEGITQESHGLAVWSVKGVVHAEVTFVEFECRIG